jgi:hypothetical protein
LKKAPEAPQAQQVPQAPQAPQAHHKHKIGSAYNLKFDPQFKGHMAAFKGHFASYYHAVLIKLHLFSYLLMPVPFEKCTGTH